jgi:hypothetical protein
MAITGECCVGVYQGHAIELVRNNWNKTLTLCIDGKEVARASCLLPGQFTLTGSLEHDGAGHAVVARSTPHRLLLTKESMTVDGTDLPVSYKPPRGLLKALFRDARAGDAASILTVGAFVAGLVGLLVVAGVTLMGRLR